MLSVQLGVRLWPWGTPGSVVGHGTVFQLVREHWGHGTATGDDWHIRPTISRVLPPRCPGCPGPSRRPPLAWVVLLCLILLIARNVTEVVDIVDLGRLTGGRGDRLCGSSIIPAAQMKGYRV